MKQAYAWHFSKSTTRLSHGGGPLAVGEWLPAIANPLLCSRGYHASVTALDALSYHLGNGASLVETRGAHRWGDDKFCASERRHVWIYDASEELRRFARVAALEVIDRWNAPQAVRDWLETGAEERMDAAYSAAYSAARSAAYYAAYSAAYSAARSAALSATRSATLSVAYSAALSVAYSATRSAAYSDLNAILESLLIQGAIDRGLWD